MLHFVPEPQPHPAPYAEAVARLASLRQALRIVDGFGAGPADDISEAEASRSLHSASPAKQRVFDSRSAATAAAAAAGLEAILEVRELGMEPHEPALSLVAAEIRAGLADLSSLLRA